MQHPAQNGRSDRLAIPVAYLVLAAIAAWVQWNKWQAMHHTRNLVALLLSILAILIAGRYLLRGLEAKQCGNLETRR